MAIANDYDYYQINVTAGYNDVRISLTFTHAMGDIDAILLDSTGYPAACISGSPYGQSNTNNEYIQCVVYETDDTTCYVRVYPDSSTGNMYDFWWDDVLYSVDLSGFSAIGLEHAVRIIWSTSEE